jgi:hypothetical protein
MAARKIAKLILPVLKGLIVGGLLVAWAGHSAKAQNIFWSNYVLGTIGSANYAGMDVNESFIAIPGSGGGAFGTVEPEQMATDGTYIYWVNQGKGTIGRATLSGGEVNDSFITGNAYLGVAVGGGYIFWTEPPTPNDNDTQYVAFIGRANLDGSDVNEQFITVSQNLPTSLAVFGDYLYWTNNSSNTSSAVGRAKLNGTGVDVTFLQVSTPSMNGIAVNGTYIYWSTEFNNLGRANLDGTSVQENFINTTGGDIGQIAVDPFYIYWLNGNVIARANLDGTDVNPSFVSVDDRLLGIAVAAPVPSCGMGGEVAPLLPLVFWLRSRRRRVAGGTLLLNR